MSNAKTTVLEIINGAAVWMTQNELIDASGLTTGTVSPALKELLGENAIQRIKPPAGWAKGVQFIYGMLGLAAPEPSADTHKPERPKKRKTKKKAAKPKRPAKRKGKRGKAKRTDRTAPVGFTPASMGDVRVALTAKGAQLLGKSLPLTPRWALTNEGSFLLLDTGFEITKPAARALVDFVRMLDGAAA